MPKIIHVKLVKGKGKGKARAKPKEKSKTKQKQKQKQNVTVNVSGGGSGGGGTSFIPMPQAPAFDYSLLASLIRPANTINVPIREAVNIPNPVQQRPAEEEPLRAQNIYREPFIKKEVINLESETETTDPQKKKSNRPTTYKTKGKGSTIEKHQNIGKNVMNEFAMRGGGGYDTETALKEVEASSTGKMGGFI